MAACVLYATLTGREPPDLAEAPSPGLSARQASELAERVRRALEPSSQLSPQLSPQTP